MIYRSTKHHPLTTELTQTHPQISAAYPDVPIRNLWELLIDITNRPKWDSMCSAAEEMETIGSDQSQGATRQASVTYMATKGMFPGEEGSISIAWRATVVGETEQDSERTPVLQQ